MATPPAEPSSAAQAGLTFRLNGEPVVAQGISPTTTVLEWLRRTGRTGSKCGCAEGDCGACSIVLVDRDADGRTAYRSVNSCLMLMPMLAGRDVLTVEGIAVSDVLHPVQASMVEHYGSQCGYCTPGFVASLFEGYYHGALERPAGVADQLCGNLCRCTGYRPIRDAALAAAKASSPLNPLDGFAQRLLMPGAAVPATRYTAEGQSFFRPDSLAELFELRRRHPDARLVAGATEIGVELNKKSRQFPVLISTESVPELTRIQTTPAEHRIGAAATLTNIEERVAPDYPSLARMLAVFASRQIRNRATLGGNLVTASPIGDSAPVLLTLDASVVLASTLGERVVPLHEFFLAYRKTQLRPDEIMKEIIVPRTPATTGLTRRLDFQKVSHRRELDISIVAGAFRVDTDGDGVVRDVRIAFGGVAPTPVRAYATEQFLLGSRLSETAADAARLLSSQFEPITDVRGSADYRRALVGSLWHKFVHGARSAVADEQPVFVRTQAWAPVDSTRALRHESAKGHVTGHAQYADDTAQQRPMLEVWPVLSPHAHARILRRDAKVAKSAPGVVAVLLAEDIPGENNVGVARQDEPLLAHDRVEYHGQIIALVVGTSLAACRSAAARIEVDYEPLPPVLTIADAVARQHFHTAPRTFRRGDAATALESAPRKLAGEFACGGQEHFYLETHAAWAECGDDGDVQVTSSTQHPSEIQSIVSEVLHLPRHKVVVHSPRMGGGFGGKETQGNTPAALVALAAVKTGRPVRLQWDRDVDMVVTGKRHPFHARFEVGFDEQGRLRALRADVVSNGGWSLDLSQPVLDRALFHIDNAYYIPALHVTGRVAKTNTASNTAFRGFGGPQGMLIIEEIMDRVARAVGLPPEVVRERNLYHGTGQTNTTHYGEEIGDNRIQEVWHAVLTQARFAQRRAETAAWNAAHPMIKRGLAVTPVKFGISFTLTHYNQAGALVHVFQDGTVQVNHGGTEMGQGLHTKVLGIAMRELGLPAAAIRVMRTSTDKVPNTSATAASSGADLNGAAVRAACSVLRARMAAVASGLLAKRTAGAAGHEVHVDIAADSGDTRHAPHAAAAFPAEKLEFAAGFIGVPGRSEHRVSFAEVAVQCYVERVSLSATGFYATPEISWNWSTMAGRPFAYFACGAAVSEVEVDGYTGMSRVRQVDIVHDAGDSLNPGVDRGQIEGGFVQGMGWLTSEELKWNEHGELLTHGASTYQIPAFSDAPMTFNVSLLANAENPRAVHGSKAVGEPPLMLAISVREAIRDAIAAFGASPSQVPLSAPATPEAVFTAITHVRAATAIR